MTQIKNGKARYRHAEGKTWIEVRVKSPFQLFDIRDPSPFRDRDLDDDFLEYILTSAHEHTLKTALKIVIYIENSETQELSKDSICEAIRSHLVYEIDLKSRQLREFLKRAQWFMLVGLLILGACIGVAQNIFSTQDTGLAAILREGVVIFGWVSLWKPIELLLFDWFPLYEKIRLFKKILNTEITVHFSSKPE